jgi:hypothetical protein
MNQPWEYRLEIIDGYMRPVFDWMEPERNELMWGLLLPFPASASALLEDVRRVQSGEIEEWVSENPESRITCMKRVLVIEGRPGEGQGHGPVSIKLPLREAALLMRRWLFECAWREQQRKEAPAGARVSP